MKNGDHILNFFWQCKRITTLLVVEMSVLAFKGVVKYVFQWHGINPPSHKNDFFGDMDTKREATREDISVPSQHNAV